MEDEILKEFLAESNENLARLDVEIVELEKHPTEKSLLASIFRTIHTIKGTCGFIGLSRLGAVAHAGENVLGQMRDGSLVVTQNAISKVLEAIDAIKDILRNIEETGAEPECDHTALIAALNEMAAGGESASAAASAPTESVTAPPPAAPAKAATVEIETAATPPSKPVAPQSAIAAPAPSTQAAAPRPANPVPQTEGDGDHGDPNRRHVADLSIRVNVDVLDRLMNLVGELVLTRNQLLQMVRGEDDSKYTAPITHLNRVTTDLQEGVMKTRMQPIGNAWSKLPRLVRDLSATTGKQIELEMVGAETELDRTVLDAIKDPLTHMVRNSADHGIESSESRRAVGKPEVGKVRLNAWHEGGHVIIVIEDDGKGIAIESVRQKAIKNGLVTESDAAKLSDKELLQFVFLPGFSTAEKVTSVSGRGVGMDVVKTQIERIGGTVDIVSRSGLGTTIRIKIPLTLAIISALVVESGKLSFAIPQLCVVELVRLAAEDRKRRIERIHKQEVFRLRNRLLPLLHLDRLLQFPERDASQEDVNIVVVQVGEDQFGLIVDEVFDTEEIVVKPVGQLLKNIAMYQGTTILGDGRVIMILDAAGVASAAGGLSAHSSVDRESRGDSANEETETTTLLLFQGPERSTMAVPLALVARLEEIPSSSIEKSGDRLLVQYRGSLLPLLPIHGATRGKLLDPQPVVVFTEGDHSMGLMVDQIQDIIEERLVIRTSSQRQGVLGTAIVNGKATDIVDTNHYVTQANPEWFARQVEATQRKRVLVIDDSVFFRQLVTTALETEGYKVRTIDSAKGALAVLERGEVFDVIVSDIDMPDIDGFEFASQVKSRRLTTAPLLALTSLTASHHAKAVQSGFAKVITKFNPKSFLSTLEEFASHQGPAAKKGATA